MQVSRAIDLPVLPRSVEQRQPGFYRDTRRGHRVVLLCEPAPILVDEGHEGLQTLSTWECPSNPDDQFTSPLINFDNMHHMGGYLWRFHTDGLTEHDRLLARVLSGQKPGACTGYMCESWNSDSEANLRHATAFRNRVLEAGLGATPLYTMEWSKGIERYMFGFTRAGTLRDNYDLAAWRDAWVAYGLPASLADHMVDTYGDRTLLDLMNTFEEDEYELPPHIRGLLLGFPLCTTIQYMGGALWV